MLNPVELQGQIWWRSYPTFRSPAGVISPSLERRVKTRLALSMGVEPIASPFGGVRSVH